MDTERQINEAMEIGRANQEIIQLLQNWCAHLVVEIWGGVGLVEQATGLPIGMRRITCPYAKASGIAAMDMSHVALDFYDRNCNGCPDRMPVRLPNITSLLEKREREQKMVTEAIERAEKEKAERLAARKVERQSIQTSDSLKSGILEMLDKFDSDPTQNNAEILLQTARTAPNYFDQDIQTALFRLCEDPDETRIGPTLEALKIVGANEPQLASAALQALERNQCCKVAAFIAIPLLNTGLRDLTIKALPAIISLVPSVRPMFSLEEIPGNPDLLLACYQLFPEEVNREIRKMLRSEHKRVRIIACQAAREIVIKLRPEYSLDLAEELVQSMGLPDDHYDGSARGEVIETLSVAFDLLPNELELKLQEISKKAMGSSVEVLFNVYTNFLESKRRSKDKPNRIAEEIAFKRIVDVLVTCPKDERLNQAGHFLRDSARYYLHMIDVNADVLLGAIALIIHDRKTPNESDLITRPNLIDGLANFRHQNDLWLVLTEITEAISNAAQKNAATARKIIQLLENSRELDEEFLSILIECLGMVATNQHCFYLVFPHLYSAMMHTSQLVRASAAKAYGQVAKRETESIPVLMQKTFFILLQDPYVIVHKAAARTLGQIDVPTEYLEEAIGCVLVLINTYNKSHADDEFLGELIILFLGLSDRSSEVPSKTLSKIVGLIESMNVDKAAGLLPRLKWRLRTIPGYADLLLRLLSDSKVPEYFLQNLIDEVEELADDDIRRLRTILQTVEAELVKRGKVVTDMIIEILTVANAFDSAVGTAKQSFDRLDDTRWNYSRKLIARSVLIASQIELAISEGKVSEVVALVKDWKEVRKEIIKDDEENKKSRNPM